MDMLTNMQKRELKARVAKLSETLSDGDEIDNYILHRFINRQQLEKPKKVGKGPECEFLCPHCETSLYGYLAWKGDMYCHVCGQHIKHPTRAKGWRMDFTG